MSVMRASPLSLSSSTSAQACGHKLPPGTALDQAPLNDSRPRPITYSVIQNIEFLCLALSDHGLRCVCDCKPHAVCSIYLLQLCRKRMWPSISSCCPAVCCSRDTSAVSLQFAEKTQLTYTLHPATASVESANGLVHVRVEVVSKGVMIVEVVGGCNSSGRSSRMASFGRPVNGFHELLEGHQGGMDATALVEDALSR